MSISNLLSQVLLNFGDDFYAHREDLSAALLTADKQLWLGSDETSTIERLSLLEPDKFSEQRNYRVSDFIPLPAPDDKEIDIEGLAYSDYYLWFVGSHSYKRKKNKPDKSGQKNIKRLGKIETEANRYILGRIPLVDGQLLPSCPHPGNHNINLTAAKLEITPQGNILMNALASDLHLGPFIKAAIPGKDNGFDVEGLVVCQNRVFLGLRGPVVRGWAIMLEIELEESSLGVLRLRPIGSEGCLYKKHFINLNGLGIRDLCLDGDDLLILAGATMDLDADLRVHRLKNGVHLPENTLHEPEIILNIPHGLRSDKAEGITLFQDVTGVPSLLVVYDTPAETRKIGEFGVLADVFKLPG